MENAITEEVTVGNFVVFELCSKRNKHNYTCNYLNDIQLFSLRKVFELICGFGEISSRIRISLSPRLIVNSVPSQMKL